MKQLDLFKQFNLNVRGLDLPEGKVLAIVHDVEGYIDDNLLSKRQEVIAQFRLRTEDNEVMPINANQCQSW